MTSLTREAARARAELIRVDGYHLELDLERTATSGTSAR